MKCPRCTRALPYAALRCGECGFTLHDVDSRLGNDSVYLARVNNANGIFTAAELAEVEAVLDQFEKEFPQLFVAVYSAALPSTINIREFAFWLLNRAAIASVEITRPNENGCLLVLDSMSGQAILVVGYLLECYATEEELADCLSKGLASWSSGKMVQGTKLVVEAFSKVLKSKYFLVRKDPGKFAPNHPVDPPMPEFTRLHEVKPVDAPTVKPDANEKL